jgi:DNA invertase Pin-like site-specific DNA recombinase
MAELGYARVSTTRQDLERQLDALTRAGIPAERIHTDKKTGATTDRPGLTELLGYARDGDTIVVTNLDRLGRNLRECLNLVHDLSERGIGIKTLSDPLPIDTTDDSAMAEVSVALLAMFAHMERVFSRERAAHARAVAATHGRAAGRPRKLTDDALSAARASVQAGMGVEQVAALFGVSRATLYRHLSAVVDETVSA